MSKISFDFGAIMGFYSLVASNIACEGTDHLKKEVHMKSAMLIVSLVLLGSFTQAKDRFLVQFKSEQGYRAMESYYSQIESTARTQVDLGHVHAIILTTKNLAFIQSLKNHPEVESVEAEKFFPAPKPVNGFKMAQQIYFEKAKSKNKKQKPVKGNSTDVPVLQIGEATPWGIMAVNAGDAWEQSAAGKNSRTVSSNTR